MGDLLGKIGVSGAAGILLGILAIVLIGPKTAGGAALLIVICTALAIMVGAVIRMFRSR